MVDPLIHYRGIVMAAFLRLSEGYAGAGEAQDDAIARIRGFEGVQRA